VGCDHRFTTPPDSWSDDWAGSTRTGLVLPAKKTDLLFRAGLANWTDYRPGHRFYTSVNNASWIDIVVALDAAGIECGLTGGCAVNNRMPVGGGMDPILYVRDMDKAAEALDLVRAVTSPSCRMTACARLARKSRLVTSMCKAYEWSQ